MKNIEIYTKQFCPFCIRAKALLDSKGVTYVEYEVSRDAELQREMRKRSNRATVPQIFIEGVHFGSSDDLLTLERNGELDALISTKAA